MAHALDLEVIAEGVETRQQLEFLIEHACDQFQGYLLARPTSLDAFEQLVEERVNGTLRHTQAMPCSGSQLAAAAGPWR